MKFILQVLFYTIITCVCHCQNTIGVPQILNFTTNDFKAGLQTWDIKQDDWGRMYFANNDGLLTFDGSNFKLYPQPNKSILRSIAIDKNRIYAGGQDELGYYSPNSNGILQYTSLKNLIPKSNNKFTDVWDIEVYKESIFFRTWDQIYQYKDQTIQAYPALSGWDILKLAGDKLLAQDNKNGLFQFINATWQPLCKPNTPHNFIITSIVQLNGDSLLVSTLQNGLYFFGHGIFSKKNTALDKDLITSRIYCFEKINANEYVAGTTSKGCIILNIAGQMVQQITRLDGMLNNNVLCVFLDRDKNIWAGLNNGISFIAYNSAIKYINPDNVNELTGYATHVFNNNLYIGTSDGAYTAPLNKQNIDLSFCRANFTQIKNTDGQVWHFNEINHQLLMGHHNGSSVITNNQAVQLTHEAGMWLFMPLSNIFPSQYVLAGTYDGLNMYEFKNNKFYNNGTVSGLYESFRFMVLDNNDDIWTSHPYRGVYKIQLAANKKSYTSRLFTQKDGLPSTLRNNVFKIKNRVVFATQNGIYEFNDSISKFIQSPLLYNIFGNISIQYLTEDEAGNIWFCAEKKMGIANYNAAEKKYFIIYFPELTGKILAGFENIYPYNKQNIFIASNKGIIHLNYEKYIANKTHLKVLLTQVNTFEKKDSLIFGGYFNEAIDTNNTDNNNNILRFANNNNSFHFEFSSPAFSLQNNIGYSYQLQGYESNWMPWTNNTTKDYTNLSSGNYTFKIKAHDNLGNETKTIKYSFSVNPPWYKTNWAYLLYTIFIIALINFYYKWQNKKFVLQQKKYEEEQKRLKYIHLLETEKNEKKIIELQNEKLINEMIFKNQELADVSMHLVERSDALIKIKDELQKLYKKTGDNHDIKKTIRMVNDIEKNNATWEQFATHFNEVNNNLLKKLKTKFPNLTNTDLKVCTYLQLKLSSKEIAQLLNITVRGVEISRYRLRKKLQLPAEKSLTDFLIETLEEK